ncbi:MAG: LppX_LprAFG lipoprotein, partial [Acidimicrobiales bacterium]
APALHFAITSQGVGTTGTEITGGQGDLARPDQLKGSFRIIFNGLAVTINVAAGSGKFYIQPPFQTSYTLTDPSKYGLGNPADLIDPTKGVSGLLTNAQTATSAGQKRVGGEVLDEVRATVSGDKVPVLPDQSKSQPVVMMAGINPSTHQLRQVTLTGPFISATSDATYTVTLTRYGEPFHVTLPST